MNEEIIEVETNEDTTTVLELSVSNAIGIQAVTIKPEPGKPVMLTGANEAGKSSILWALECFKGKKFRPADFIRHGSDRATLELKTSRWEARLIVTEKTERLEVRAPDSGAKFSSPQTILDAWFGDVSFDPLAFKGMRMDEQVRIIREIAGIDLSAYDNAEEERRTDATIAGRELKSAQAVLDSLHGPDADLYHGTFDTLPDKPVSPDELLAVIDQCDVEQKAFEDYQERRDGIAEAITVIDDGIQKRVAEIERLKNEITALEEGIQALNSKSDALKVELNRMVPPEVEGFEDRRVEARAKLKAIQVINSQIQAKQQYVNTSRDVEGKVLALNEAKLNLEAVREQRRRALAEARYPIRGLALTEDGIVTYRDVRIDQLSDGAAIKVSCAIAMALNPGLRTILIRNGSLLDSHGKQAIFDMARSKGYQVWMEVCEEPKTLNGETHYPAGFYLEHGHVVAIDGVPVIQQRGTHESDQ